MPFLDIHTHSSSVYADDHIAIKNVLWPCVDQEAVNAPCISLGIHPWNGKLDTLSEDIRELENVAGKPAVKLIGECGLDKLQGESIANQMLIFEQQVLLAEKLNKPVIIHCVRAFNELIFLKKKLKPSVPMIIHGFNRNEMLAKQLFQSGFSLSFGADVLKANSHAANIVAKLPEASMFFLETDDRLVSIEEIYLRVAELRKITLPVLKDYIFASWKKINIL